MNKIKSSFSSTFVCAGLILLGLAACADLNYPSGGYNTGYSSPNYGGGYYDRGERDWERERERREWERDRREWKEDRRERERERDRRREEERRREQEERENAMRPTPTPPKPQLNCPPGTHPSTHRCTKEERKRGCKDYGGSNGMGCSNF